MLSKNLLDEMNNQIREELYSAYLYLAMSAHFDEDNWNGFASWMAKQATEEREHAMKFYGYIHDRGGKVTLQAIAQPPAEFGSHKEIFEAAYAHEQKVTARINLLYSIAVKDNDYASQQFLDWFVKEQVEEEKTASEIVDWLTKAGNSVNSLFQVNGYLARRE